MHKNSVYKKAVRFWQKIRSFRLVHGLVIGVLLGVTFTRKAYGPAQACSSVAYSDDLLYQEIENLLLQCSALPCAAPTWRFNYTVNYHLLGGWLSNGSAYRAPIGQECPPGDDRLARWLDRRQFCDGRVDVYGRNIFRFSDMQVDLSKVRLSASTDIYASSYESQYEYGAFRFECPSRNFRPRSIKLYENPWLTFFNDDVNRERWLRSVAMDSAGPGGSEAGEQRRLDNGLLHTRVENLNLWHSATELFAVFVAARTLGWPLNTTTLLLLDRRPASSLDPWWAALFGTRILHADQLSNQRLLFRNLAWSSGGHKSWLHLLYCPAIPYVDDFRAATLHAFGIHDTHKLDCQQVRLLFSVRRSSNVGRKLERIIGNDQQIVNSVRKYFTLSGLLVDAVDMEKVPLEAQLELHAKTDILIGMHGAGLTHGLFLKNTSVLIELKTSATTEWPFFESLARWRGLRYWNWMGNSSDTDSTGAHIIRPQIVIELIKLALNYLCPLPQTASYLMPTN